MLSNNSIERLCLVYAALQTLQKTNVEYISSKDLARLAGTTDSCVRKDISTLNITGYNRKGYNVGSLKKQIGASLRLSRSYKTCIVGLGRLGTALLDHKALKDDGFEIVAGFDNSINKIERLHTSVEVFAVNELEKIVKQRGIEIGIITAPKEAAQEIADKLVKGGVRGILNFAPVQLSVPDSIVLNNMDVTVALRFIAAQI
ncbi:MAG: redox-sensing transcriptional repressor Rex [Candidatus Margulisbacteria bacterium]|nr:redox-sensing transcriptional repressor Rex [Candidatus Margulisiibacteriota bacterium]